MNVSEKIREDAGPEDFGIPAEYAERARLYANWLTFRPAIAPPVAAGSVDKREIANLLDTFANMHAHGSDQQLKDAGNAIHTWGAQQREAEKLKVEQSVVMALDQAHQQTKDAECRANKLRQRAEKAEAELDTLRESLRLVNVDHGLWMARTHAAEDARDDALARVKELEAKPDNEQ